MTPDIPTPLPVPTCDSGAAGWAMTHPGFMAGYITAT